MGFVTFLPQFLYKDPDNHEGEFVCASQVCTVMSVKERFTDSLSSTNV